MTSTSLTEGRHPDTRELRALALYRERGRDIVLIGRDTYEVPSQDGTRVYEVVYGGEVETCTCADHTYRGASFTCVHLLAVGACRAKRRGQSARHLPDHEKIRRDSAANPQRSYSEHVQASRAIAGRTYVEDLKRAQRRELEADELGL